PTGPGSSPRATSASVTDSSTARRLARTATHTSRSGAAAPRYSTSSERRPREPVAAVGAALAADETALPQVAHDVLEELERDLLRLRDPLGLDRTFAC